MDKYPVRTTPKRDHLTARRIATGLFALPPALTLLAACGESEPQASSTTVDTFEKSFSLKLEAFDFEAPRSFTVGDRKVTIIKENGSDKDAFSDKQIRDDIGNSLRLQDEGEKSIRISMPGDFLDIAFTTEPAEYTQHDYMIFSDEADVVAATGQQIPGAVTAINLDKTGSKGVEALTMLAHYDDDKGAVRFGQGRLSIDTYNLAVETCNNLTDIKLTDETIRQLTKIAGSEGELQKIMPVFVKLLKESSCNSFAAITAAKEAGYSYEEYLQLTADLKLGSTAKLGLNFDVPYVQYSEEYWKSL